MPVRHGIVPVSRTEYRHPRGSVAPFREHAAVLRAARADLPIRHKAGATGGPAFYPGSWIGLASGKPQRRRRAESGRRVRDRFAHISNLRSPATARSHPLPPSRLRFLTPFCGGNRLTNPGHRGASREAPARSARAVGFQSFLVDKCNTGNPCTTHEKR